MSKLILASGSPRRRELLSQVGISYEVIPSLADENIGETNPVVLVEQLSARKAGEVAQRAACGQGGSPCVVLGADTVVAVDGNILGKPENEAQAYEMLKSLQGKKHQVYTGVSIVRCDGVQETIQTFHVATDVEVYPMTDEEIRTYIATGDPMDKAGGYGIQGPFAAYIKGIAGDYYNVVGLPVSRVVHELKKMALVLDS